MSLLISSHSFQTTNGQKAELDLTYVIRRLIIKNIKYKTAFQSKADHQLNIKLQQQQQF